MAISIKTPEDIKKMHIAGQLAAKVLEMIKPYVKPGISTSKLDHICNDYIVNEQHTVSACLSYHSYPKSICISINEVVCHSIPDNAKLLKDGNIINIDVTIIKDGFHSNTSKMFIISKPTIMGKHLCHITQESLYLALHMVKPGINLHKISAAIQKFVKAEGFSIIHEYCRHSIGHSFHEEPQVLHYDSHETNIILKPGMTFTIKPMVNTGKKEIHTMKDGWTVKTKDHSLSAQYEHTIVVTDNSCKILTLHKDDTIPAIISHNK